ncbi:hypothetical protein HO173_012458 [Letharia columbiana]|uniref:Nudix hydrolase domain-containing protein n=1 Tax=Letharia columbiana TaxID=112416 RepID=A0A8H6CND9_9LECA|nr:uncharacterized protein HO173_012458 [Letharia columbiana]KAF6226628.1 hypothetical protein HO173_012458 [Letharia columbiana]
MKTGLDLVNECDNFPYYESDPEEYSRLRSTSWELHLEGGSGPYGYIKQSVVEKMPWDHDAWQIDDEKKCITPAPKRYTHTQETVIRETLEVAKTRDIFQILRGWRNELYPVHGPYSSRKPMVSMERAGSALFGINTYGVHMTAYVNTPQGMKIWVPRRARNKQTYGGMLDNTVAGGLSTGEKPFECVVREAAEEASFSEQLVRSNAKPCGTVSYFHIRDARAGGEAGLLQPECQYVFDMEIGAEVIPKPGDNEVEEFYLWTVDEVKRALAEGQFKPNCAAVLLDFFIRRGILTAENEKDYTEIVSRLHRKLPFPTS